MCCSAIWTVNHSHHDFARHLHLGCSPLHLIDLAQVEMLNVPRVTINQDLLLLYVSFLVIIVITDAEMKSRCPEEPWAVGEQSLSPEALEEDDSG
jgi:hypothetical protein